jgi:hypothetical protein
MTHATCGTHECVLVGMSACWLPLGSHPGLVGGEWLEPGLRAAFVQSLSVLDRAGPEFAADDGELGAIKLRLPAWTRTRSSR